MITENLTFSFFVPGLLCVPEAWPASEVRKDQTAPKLETRRAGWLGVVGYRPPSDAMARTWDSIKQAFNCQ
jgi:hypothetical protein